MECLSSLAQQVLAAATAVHRAEHASATVSDGVMNGDTAMRDQSTVSNAVDQSPLRNLTESPPCTHTIDHMVEVVAGSHAQASVERRLSSDVDNASPSKRVCREHGTNTAAAVASAQGSSQREHMAMNVDTGVMVTACHGPAVSSSSGLTSDHATATPMDFNDDSDHALLMMALDMHELQSKTAFTSGDHVPHDPTGGSVLTSPSRHNTHAAFVTAISAGYVRGSVIEVRDQNSINPLNGAFFLERVSQYPLLSSYDSTLTCICYVRVYNASA